MYQLTGMSVNGVCTFAAPGVQAVYAGSPGVLKAEIADGVLTLTGIGPGVCTVTVILSSGCVIVQTVTVVDAGTHAASASAHPAPGAPKK